ncbi:hypothetical protein BGZ76_002447, partial [Entomortierella beljakovae]
HSEELGPLYIGSSLKPAINNFVFLSHYTIVHHKQGGNESDANYTYRIELTLKLLPFEVTPVRPKASTSTEAAADEPSGSPYNLSPDTEAEISLSLCYGLRSDHPIRLKNCATPSTIKETIELILKYDEPNRYGILQESNGNLITPRHEMTNQMNTQGPEWNEDISIGSHVVSNSAYSKFKNDVGQDVVNDAAMDELANMFGAWKIAAVTDEPDRSKRVASTINKMGPNFNQNRDNKVMDYSLDHLNVGGIGASSSTFPIQPIPSQSSSYAPLQFPTDFEHPRQQFHGPPFVVPSREQSRVVTFNDLCQATPVFVAPA